MEDNENVMISKNEINKAILHLHWANRRMLIALIAVCITAVTISIGAILIFVNSYTDRDRDWKETIRDIVNRTSVTEVYNDGQKEH